MKDLLKEAIIDILFDEIKDNITYKPCSDSYTIDCGGANKTFSQNWLETDEVEVSLEKLEQLQKAFTEIQEELKVKLTKFGTIFNN
jgi:hypothetical protein